MRGLIDATALGSGRGGDETMLRGVIRGLGLTAPDGDRYTILSDSDEVGQLAGQFPEVLHVERMVRRPGAVHFSADLPLYLARHRSAFDVVFTVTHAPLRSPVPVALMVQDLSFLHLPDVYPRRTRRRLTALVGHQARRAAAVLTVSNFCRRDLITSYGLASDRVHVVPNAIEVPPPLPSGRREAALSALARHHVDTAPFLLYLGNLHPRKNVARTIRAFTEARRTAPALARHRLLIAGARWWGSGEAEAAEAAPPGSVVLLGRVDDDTRLLLLELADALLYLSRFEGFGLPPLEAMAAGTPVLAGDAAAIPEVTAGAALLVDPYDDRAITAGIGRIVTDEILRAELITRGRARVATYDLTSTGVALRRALERATNNVIVDS